MTKIVIPREVAESTPTKASLARMDPGTSRRMTKIVIPREIAESTPAKASLARVNPDDFAQDDGMR